MNATFGIKNYADFPDLADQGQSLGNSLTPGFLLADEADVKYWPRLTSEEFLSYQFVITDKRAQLLVGAVNSIPVVWNGPLDMLPDEGWDWAIANGSSDGNWLCALLVAILPAYRKLGLAEEALRTLKKIGQQSGHQGVIVPVRPTRKPEFPHLPMEEYLTKKSHDGSHYDPWLRLHLGLGGRMIKICPRAMTVRLPIETWRQYGAQDDKAFENQMLITDGLVPIKILPDEGVGLYEEPNIWMVHSFD